MKKSAAIRSKTLLKTFGFISAAVLCTSPLKAADYTWNLPGAGVWDTTTANWTGAGTTWVNGSGNNAAFSLSVGGAVSLGTNITLGTLSTNGGATVQFNTGAGTSIDVTQISTAGTSGSSGSIDMFKVLTGNHDLNYSSTGTVNNQGRLNLKAAATYTGDTFLTGTAYLLSDNVSNALPTGTTLNMASGTTFRINKINTTQEIAGLVGSGTATVSNGTAGNTLTISTKASTSTVYSGNVTSTVGLNIVVTGSGTQTLSGTNSYNGSTTVSGGMLIVGSNLSATTSVTVNGGTLASSTGNKNLGVGAVSLSSGAITPGGIGTVGTFTLAANQNFSTTAAGSGTLNFDLGTSFDRILGSGTGTFTLQDTTIALNQIAGFNVANTYNIFGGFASSAALSNVTFTYNGAAFAGYTAILDNTTGNLTFAAVPEPSTYALLGLGLAGLFFLRRRLSKTLPA